MSNPIWPPKITKVACDNFIDLFDLVRACKAELFICREKHGGQFPTFAQVALHHNLGNLIDRIREGLDNADIKEKNNMGSIGRSKRKMDRRKTD